MVFTENTRQGWAKNIFFFIFHPPYSQSKLSKTRPNLQRLSWRLGLTTSVTNLLTNISTRKSPANGQSRQLSINVNPLVFQNTAQISEFQNALAKRSLKIAKLRFNHWGPRWRSRAKIKENSSSR